MKHITVVVNKDWETEGVMSVLLSRSLRPSSLPSPVEPCKQEGAKKGDPRAVFFLPNKDNPVLKVTVRCTQDLMDPQKSSSSSEEKFKVLPTALLVDNPDLIVSVSTAGYIADVSRNGSVVIGGNFFLHDGNPDNPDSRLRHPNIGKLLENNVNPKIFELVNSEFKNSVEPKFLKTPLNPCQQPACIASSVFTALSVVNITKYQEYNWADEEAVEHFLDEKIKFPCRSSETTHGVVKLCSDKPIIFLSPITDQFGNFDFEVSATQNFAASFNGGMVVAQLICALADFVKSGEKFGLN